jgi:hypothetical protein
MLQNMFKLSIRELDFVSLSDGSEADYCSLQLQHGHEVGVNAGVLAELTELRVAHFPLFAGKMLGKHLLQPAAVLFKETVQVTLHIFKL